MTPQEKAFTYLVAVYGRSEALKAFAAIDNVPWLVCTRCNDYTPHTGNKCLDCGNVNV